MIASAQVTADPKNAFYAVNRLDNQSGHLTTAMNKAKLRDYIRLVGNVDFPNVELAKYAAKVAIDDGSLGARKAELLLGFAYRLSRQLPSLRAHALKLGHIGVELACAIERGLQDVPREEDTDVLRRLDQMLVTYLTATQPNQSLPAPRVLQHKIEQWLVWMDALTETARAEQPNPHYEVTFDSKPGMALITAEMDALAAAEFDQHVTVHANSRKISKVEALMELVCGDPETRPKHRKVVLFGVGSFRPDVPLRGECIHGVGALNPAQQAEIAAAGAHYCNALDVAQITSDTHDPTPEQRMVVAERDGTCRFPGCDVDARDCDTDHVINFEAGGWTTVSNLQALCREHHNMKTDRRVFSEMSIDAAVTWRDPETNEVIATTVPEGPLAGISGTLEGITTRHSGKTKDDDNIAPPKNDGRGNWGYTWDSKNQRIRTQRNERRKQAAEDLEPPF